jgi:hypothetical protein
METRAPQPPPAVLDPHGSRRAQAMAPSPCSNGLKRSGPVPSGLCVISAPTASCSECCQKGIDRFITKRSSRSPLHGPGVLDQSECTPGGAVEELWNALPWKPPPGEFWRGWSSSRADGLARVERLGSRRAAPVPDAVQACAVERESSQGLVAAVNAKRPRRTSTRESRFAATGKLASRPVSFSLVLLALCGLLRGSQPS